MKCNYDVELIKLLIDLGCGMDCASKVFTLNCVYVYIYMYLITKVILRIFFNSNMPSNIYDVLDSASQMFQAQEMI